MSKRSFIIRLLIIPLLVLMYAYSLFHHFNESDVRLLRLTEEASAADQVLVVIKIVSADMNGGEVRARLRFRLAGAIAEDEITPAVDLKLLLNTSHGQQQYDFPEGVRMNPIEAVFSLDGDSNKYPFDRHQAAIWLLITKPSTPNRNAISKAPRIPKLAALPAAADAQAKPPAQPSKRMFGRAEKKPGTATPPAAQPAAPPAAAVVPQQTMSEPSSLVVGTAALERHEPVLLSIDLSASIPGIKFGGSIAGHEPDDVTQIDLTLRRANNVIVVSIVVMTMMGCLALSLLAMAVTATARGEESALLPLSLSVSLIFGLPALRQVQPAVPPVGVLGDYVAFLWAELIVAGATVVVVGTWIVRSRRLQAARHSRESTSKT